MTIHVTTPGITAAIGFVVACVFLYKEGICKLDGIRVLTAIPWTIITIGIGTLGGAMIGSEPLIIIPMIMAPLVYIFLRANKPPKPFIIGGKR